ncbi:PHB granule-associated protein phasin2 [Candidatus Phycosocius spiralis]|uniref:PHB granule-associated protein phasin2 n=2 Tax=Candidatus Phycosocius spiralis TaxID=2815099 RepID=A0ABQ4PT54_9PROT|nr:PHB granule-associated protein phasin2 [Candidatus Phycosocius spiralis]
MTTKSDSKFTPTSEVFKASFEKLQANLGDLATHGKANLEALSTSTKIASEGLKKASELSVAYLQSSAALATQTTKNLSSAKSLQEAVEIQADYAKTAISTYFTEFTKVSDVILGAVKESVKPISERTSAWISSVQSAH